MCLKGSGGLLGASLEGLQRRLGSCGFGFHQKVWDSLGQVWCWGPEELIYFESLGLMLQIVSVAQGIFGIYAGIP